MVDIQKNIPLSDLSTFHIGGTARYFARIKTENDIPKLIQFAHKNNSPWHIVGGGSNTIFSEGMLNRLVIKMEESYIHDILETDTERYIEVGAGVSWDEVVAWTVQKNIGGIEALSGIPGTAGAGPIQNIGAYGQEICQTLIEVRVYDTKQNTFVSLPASRCHFGYRTSIFKEEQRGRYIITSVVLRLKKEAPTTPPYPEVQNYFMEHEIVNPTLSQIREVILHIRATKLPDPQKIPNVGSFFKNAIIPLSQAQKIQKQYPEVKIFPVDDAHKKIPAGWLIEQCGFKGTTIGPIGIYEKNALVLTNTGGARYQDVMRAKEIITQKIFEMFGITLEMEPNMIK